MRGREHGSRAGRRRADGGNGPWASRRRTDAAALLVEEEVVVFDDVWVVKLEQHLAFCQGLRARGDAVNFRADVMIAGSAGDTVRAVLFPLHKKNRKKEALTHYASGT
jgi:hypothetical protein